MQVCNDLRDLSVHLNEASISYFNPFRPMLGQRAAIDQVGCQVSCEEGYLDIKIVQDYCHVCILCDLGNETDGTSAVLY